jgi:hypothetical protein
MKTALFAAVAALALGAWGSAAAWHSQGHMEVAAIAWPMLTPGVQCAADKLLRSAPTYANTKAGITDAAGVDPKEALFIHAATWPDRIKSDPAHEFFKDPDAAPKKGTAAAAYADVNRGLSGPKPWPAHSYWHFVDLPVGPGPQPQWSNAEEKIESLAADLRNPAATVDQKAYALAWLIHLVGDVHQPLHTASQYGGVFAAKGDAGGNLVFLCPDTAASCDAAVLCPKGVRCQNLHGFWDALPGESDSVKVAIRAAGRLQPAGAAAAGISDVHAWVVESNALAASDVYVSPVVMGSAGAFRLTAAYKHNAKAVAQKQIPIAGARLARLLNASLAPEASCH